MKRVALAFSFFMIHLAGFCDVDNAWVNEVSKRVDEEAVTWLKERLAQVKSNKEKDSQKRSVSKQCLNNVLPISETHQVIVFISFSVPETIWLQLSEELKKVDGIFVLRGLPNNSFKALAYHLLNLKQKGVEAPIQIHPQLFREYEIEKVPTFLIKNEYGFNKLSGNVSLKYALDLFQKEDSKG